MVNELFSALTCVNSLMVSLVVGSWNTLLPTLIRIADDLEELGFRYSDDKQVYIKEEM